MKDSFYFSHDSNASQDPKILAMRSVYSWEGYGWYWMIIEMMREQQNYCLDISGKYVFNAFALQMHCTEEKAQQFITDCINEFNLFKSDGVNFWSNSLLRRMQEKDVRSQKARESAKARWDKPDDANAMQAQCDSNAIKENKEKESNITPLPPAKKDKPSKEPYSEFVYLTKDEYARLLNDFGQANLTRMIEILDIYIGQNPKKNNRYTDHNRVLRGWVKDRIEEEKQREKPRGSPCNISNIPL